MELFDSIPRSASGALKLKEQRPISTEYNTIAPRGISLALTSP